MPYMRRVNLLSHSSIIFLSSTSEAVALKFCSIRFSICYTMRRVLNLVDHFRNHAAGALSSSSRGLLVNMPMLIKARPSKQYGISSMSSISAASEPLSAPGQPNKIFVQHVIYKGKTALCMKPIAPNFGLLDSGAASISKEGSVLLAFAHSVGERQYDWNKQQVFALSVTELGSLLSLSLNESCEFFHDPFMLKSDAGKVHKVLQVTPFPNGPGYFFSLKVSNEIEKIEERFSIPITKAEFTVMQTTFNFILPYLMGWHTFTN